MMSLPPNPEGQAVSRLDELMRDPNLRFDAATQEHSEHTLYAALGTVCRQYRGIGAILFNIDPVRSSDMKRMTSHFGFDADTAAEVADRSREILTEDKPVRTLPTRFEHQISGKTVNAYLFKGCKDNLGSQVLAFVTSDTLPASAVAEIMYLGFSIIDRIAQSPRLRIPNFETISITKRESSCLHWIAEGKTTEEIALILGISPNTVNHYVSNAGNKLNASNRTHTVTKAMRMGLI